MTQNEKIYDYLEGVRPFSRTANCIFKYFEGAIPKVSVNRSLNELAKKGKVMKLGRLAEGDRGRKTRLWRATYK